MAWSTMLSWQPTSSASLMPGNGLRFAMSIRRPTLTALSQYLAIPLDTATVQWRINSAKAENVMDAAVQSKLVRKLKRTASYGDWVNWLPRKTTNVLLRRTKRGWRYWV